MKAQPRKQLEVQAVQPDAGAGCLPGPPLVGIMFAETGAWPKQPHAHESKVSSNPLRRLETARGGARCTKHVPSLARQLLSGDFERRQAVQQLAPVGTAWCLDLSRKLDACRNVVDVHDNAHVLARDGTHLGQVVLLQKVVSFHALISIMRISSVFSENWCACLTTNGQGLDARIRDLVRQIDLRQ